MKKKYVKAKKGLFCSFQRGFIKDERQRLRAPAVLFGNDNNHYCSFAAFSASMALIFSFTS